MDDGQFPPPNPPPMFDNINYDFMDQLLDEGCWLSMADGSIFSTSRGLSYPSSSSSYPLPSLEANSSTHQWSSSHNPSPLDCLKEKGEKAIIPTVKSPSFCWEDDDDENKIMWISPKMNPGPSTSVKDRLMRAIYHLKEFNRNRDVLIQIWVPIKKGLKSFLTTVEQPHFYHPTNTRLLNYRDVSEKYEFLADENTKQALGLPGRVFLGKAPEWTPDVRFFKQDEYPRVNFAHMYDVRGSIALPVFERGSGDCLGVVEMIMTTDNIDYRPEVESICKALESVELRSSDISDTSKEQADKGCFEAELEILNVLRTVSDTHNLPLAQTWASCSQQAKGGCCWHSDKNLLCISTVDSACYVRDHRVLDFHRACSEHHLLRGRGGIVGKAFETNQPCFATDITEFSKADYPLAHHAKMFGLHGAVAIRVHTTHQESRSDYVMEFYLPSNFQETGLNFHGKICQSVSMVIQQHCHSLHFMTLDKMKMESSTSQKDKQEECCSWFTPVMDPKRKGKDVAISLKFGDEEPIEDFKVFSDYGNIKQDLGSKSTVIGSCDSLSGGRLPLTARKDCDKRKTKIQKTISLKVLRQHFAGSLKDAAKNIGVCPTTLKRICRQHGITRWPSRKIQKVGHSLQKLQLVINSVQGTQGSIQLSSFYTNFPQLSSSPNNTQYKPNNDFSAINSNDQPKQHVTALDVPKLTTQPEGSMLGSGATTSNSSSSSQTSTSSHNCFSDGLKVSSPLKKEPSNHLLETSQSNNNKSLEILPPLPTTKSWVSRDHVCGLKAKATFGEEKIRFTILQNMGFRDLQQEIAKRFSFDDLSKMGIKYLDDDNEWVLLTCDDDLEECIDIHKSSGNHTIKLVVSIHSSQLGSSFGSSGLS